MTTQKKPVAAEKPVAKKPAPKDADVVEDAESQTVEADVTWRVAAGDPRVSVNAAFESRPSTLVEQLAHATTEVEHQLIHLVPACTSVTVSGATITLNTGY